MARFVKVFADVVVNPDHVASVTVDYDCDRVTVSLVTGVIHSRGRDYGKSLGETYDRVVRLLAEAGRSASA